VAPRKRQQTTRAAASDATAVGTREALPQAVRVSLGVAPDAREMRVAAATVIERMNRRLAREVRLLVVDTDAADAADVALLFAWNEADRAFEKALARAPLAKTTIVLRRSTPALVDLGDREAVLRRLAARERIDALLAGLRGHARVLAVGDDPGTAIERELTRALAALGLGSSAIDTRPRLDHGFLRRERLLRLMPDAPGHVVALEAPYGSGKSVLAAQWADALEADGCRVVWAAPDDADLPVIARLASALGIAPDTPGAIVAERLWDVETTVAVVEDVRPDADLGDLLDDPRGYLLLAGRARLEHEAVARLEASGRLTRLGADLLAFTAEEAARLTGDDRRARDLHDTTRGWALPLHVAALTGAPPEPQALLAGLRASLPAPAWSELCFLAALPYLPLAAAKPETDALVEGGFVQALGNAYRLHAWYAELLRARHLDEVAEAVRTQGHRVPLALRGEAFAAVDDRRGIADSLAAAVEAELWHTDAHRMVAWGQTIAFSERDPRVAWALGAAQRLLGQHEDAIANLERALAEPSLSPDERLGIARELFVPYALTDPERGRALIVRAEAWLPDADAEVGARYLANAALLHALTGAFDVAVDFARRALERYPPDSVYRVAAEVNLALFEWNLTGDLVARVRAQTASLERVAATYPVQALGQARDVGLLHLWLGDPDRARPYLTRASAGEDAYPGAAIAARAALAFLANDRPQLEMLRRRARLFADLEVADLCAMFAIRLALGADDLDGAEHAWEESPRRAFAASAHAVTLARGGRADEALALLAEHDDADRLVRLHLASARYRVRRDAADLNAFLEATTAGPRLLPAFVPADELPADLGLTAAYPLRALLEAGRHDAVAARAQELPPLRLELLGGFRVLLLGAPVTLTRRQQEVLTLLLLGASREQLAEEMWPHADAAKQRNNLNVQLALLRKVVEPWGFTVYLNEGGLTRVRSDHAELAAALEAADAPAVLERYREPFAAGIDLPLVDEERARLREAVVETLVAASDETRASEAYLRRVLELEPLHEEALRLLLRGLLRRGRRREAHDRYQRFAARLRDELGLEPLPETAALLG
jgi:DNA-binding SARP family transcriptional activator/tetratricopeptide (TPR) repeat protein